MKPLTRDEAPFVPEICPVCNVAVFSLAYMDYAGCHAHMIGSSNVVNLYEYRRYLRRFSK